jgi:hypothetical protein
MYAMFPLLTIPFIVYAALTLLQITGAGGAPWHEATLVSLPLYSGDNWNATGGDLFLLVSMGLLFVEIIRSTKTGQASLTNNLLSFMLFVVVLLAFILAPDFGNSTFFIFLLMTLLDPMAGQVVTTVTGRRDLTVTDGKKVVLDH